MSRPLIGGIPPNLDLDGNYVIQFTALDASTGAAVTSVIVSNASLLVDNVTGGELSVPPSDDQPLWLDLPNTVTDANGG